MVVSLIRGIIYTMKYKPTCIKCKKRYDSDEPDDYYCAVCNKIRLDIAKEVDKKIASRPPKRKRMSDLQQFDEIARQRGGGSIVKIADLGIKL